MKTTVLGRGAYTFPEAARLVRLRPARIRSWFRPSGGRSTAPVFDGDIAPVDGDYAISFLDLVDVFVAGQLREHGVPLQTLRRVFRKLQDDFGTHHAFCRRELLTDGNRVFVRGLDGKGRDEIIDVLDRQRVFPQIILPFLKSIDYGGTDRLALRWHVTKSVVVDPQICFGKPTVEAVGISTEVLATAYRANGNDALVVADWYNVQTDHVLAAVQFETGIAA